MPILRDMSEAQLAFSVAGLSDVAFEVVRYRGTEGLSQLYRFEIELSLRGESIGLAAVVGQAAVLSVNTEFGTRHFHGVISRFEHTRGGLQQHYLRAELVPPMWLLTQRYGSRIYQNQSAIDIVKAVFEGAGIGGESVVVEAEGGTAAREYCVQYRETDFNFVCRLLEEEGIWYAFRQTVEGVRIVFGDATSSYAAIPGESSALPFVPPSGMISSQEHVHRFRVGMHVRPGAVHLLDFTFKNPALDLKATSDCGRDAAFEYADFPGHYATQGDGATVAQRRAQEFECDRVVGVGESNCARLSPSAKFTLTDHPTGEKDYVVTSITHQGAALRAVRGENGLVRAQFYQALVAARSADDERIRALAEALLDVVHRIRAGDQTPTRTLTRWLHHGGQVTPLATLAAAVSGTNPLAGIAAPNLLDDAQLYDAVEFDGPEYSCAFECIPAEIVYRPARVTPWPVVRGCQTARVVGPSGEEIHCDAFGRVKVQFHWDRLGEMNENSSCWIRVSQGFAGGGYGMMFLPRVGQEVVVDFVEGDPDQPLIVGRVYNNDHMPAYTLPDEKTKSYIKTNSSTGGGATNELRFEDLAGSEQILIHAAKDFHVNVVEQMVQKYGKDSHLEVAGVQFEKVAKAAHTKIGTDLNQEIGGQLSVKVSGNAGAEVGGSYSIDGKSKLYIKSTDALVIESMKEISIKTPAAFVKIDSQGVTIQGPQIKLNCPGGVAGVGTAVSLKAPEAPAEADVAEPGADTTYTKTAETPATGEFAALDGRAWEPIERPPPSWIEIELVDEIDQPVRAEYYEIIAPDGKTLSHGVTGPDGVAHVIVPEAGNCTIRFPKLDAEAWERI